MYNQISIWGCFRGSEKEQNSSMSAFPLTSLSRNWKRANIDKGQIRHLASLRMLSEYTRAKGNRTVWMRSHKAMTSQGLKDQKRCQRTRDRRLHPWDFNFKICMNMTAKAGQQLEGHPQSQQSWGGVGVGHVMFHQQEEITWGVSLIGQFNRSHQGEAAATSWHPAH